MWEMEFVEYARPECMLVGGILSIQYYRRFPSQDRGMQACDQEICSKTHGVHALEMASVGMGSLGIDLPGME
jgi:hypothetical protein